MIIPDFTGMDPDETKKILAAQYPQISFSFLTSSAPKEIKGMKAAAVQYRIIRQRPMGDNQLEFIISPFPVTIE